MGIKKEIKLRTSFLGFVIFLGILTICLIMINYFLFAFTSIIVYPPNYSEHLIQSNFEELKDIEKVNSNLLTPMSNFGVYSNDGKYLYGNFSTKDENRIWNMYEKGEKTLGLRNYITSIERKDDILLIRYPLTTQYKTEKMRRYLPNAENTLLVMFLLELFIVIILISNKFARKMNEELKPLLVASEKIEEGDLEFVVGRSNIKEINVILQGINNMKNSLNVALQKQWMIEQQKRDQISALAHDIKTPLTIVKGNTELLNETYLTEEQEKYYIYIKESSEKIEKYIQSLLFVTTNEFKNSSSYKEINIKSFLISLKDQGKMLCKTKNINIICNVNISNKLYIYGNIEELERSLMNIISNAVNSSPVNSTIRIMNTTDKNKLILQIVDQGKGFSEKILKHGKEQFVIEDESRTNNEQHGLGLYIADNIIKKYNGEIILFNNANNNGAVIVKIPLKN